jgi:hypothetical protein
MEKKGKTVAVSKKQERVSWQPVGRRKGGLAANRKWEGMVLLVIGRE